MWALFRKAMADLGCLGDRTIKSEYRVAYTGRRAGQANGAKASGMGNLQWLKGSHHSRLQPLAKSPPI